MSKKRYLFHGTTKDGKDSIIENGIKLDVNNGGFRLDGIPFGIL